MPKKRKTVLVSWQSSYGGGTLSQRMDPKTAKGFKTLKELSGNKVTIEP